MGRWEPDARGRLARAALVLSARQGYDSTTVAQIAEVAGVSERTFYRHFADKADALFPDNSALLARLGDVAGEAAGHGSSGFDAALLAVDHLASRVELEPERALLGAQVIPTVPALAGRDLVRQHQMADALADALHTAGVPPGKARLAAEMAMLVWRVALAAWTRDQATPLPDVVRTTANEVRAI